MATAPTPGTRIAEKYEVERVLGQGGMGVVVAARHLITGNRVAIKFLLSDALTEGTVLARFLNEARAALQIQSEHVARVIDVDTLPNGSPYMVMELLDGHDLAAEIANRPLAPIKAVGFVLQALEALAEAHALGIVHRDLKPANLFVSRRRDGSSLVKVLDFGISKLTQPMGGTAPQDLTRTSGVLGSPLYMSPEQLTSAKGVDARSDVWSMGVVLYEMLTGHVPFFDETLGGLVVKIATVPVPDIRALAPGVPDGLKQVIEACLAKDPSQRLASVAALAHALEPFAPAEGRLSIDRVSRILDGAAPPASGQAPGAAGTIDPAFLRPSGGGAIHPSTQSAWAPVATTPDPVVLPVQRRGRMVAVGAGVALLLVIGVAFVMRGSASSPAAASAPPASTSVALLPTPAPVAAPSSDPVVTPATPDPSPVASAGPKADASPPTKPGAKGRPTGKPDTAVPPTPPFPPPPHGKRTGPEDFGGK